MTYAAQKKVPGREPVVIVEIDGEFCSLAYGTTPCTAALGVTGAIKCFNTRKTCQDKTNFDPDTKTYRFSSKRLPIGAPVAHPMVTNVKMNPTKIDPGQGLGVRASVSVTFQDCPIADYGVDKYIAERTYDSGSTGSYWGKWLARNPFYQNRAMRVKVGYLTRNSSGEPVYDAANFQTRLYVIEKIDGPDARGSVTVTAKDVIKLVDDERAQVPIASTGVLDADMTDVATTLVLSPTGVGDDEYPASGYVAIGEEIMSFTRASDTLTVVRARKNTQADEHDAGDAVQLCKEYSSLPIVDLLYDLLVTQGGIDPAYVNTTEWDAEADVWLSLHEMSAFLSKPTGIKTIIEELCQQALFYIWWDEIAQKIQFRAIRPPDESEITAIDETNNIVMDSVSVVQNPKDRISQVWVFYGQISPNEDVEKPSNYSRQSVYVDTDAESAFEYGEKRIKKVFARWLRSDISSPADVLAARLIARYRDNPRAVKMRLDAKDNDLWTADNVRMTSRCIQSATGEPEEAELQVMKVTEVDPGTLYEYELADAFFQGRYAYVMDNATPDYSAASDAQKRKGAFVCPNTEVFADGTQPYKII